MQIALRFDDCLLQLGRVFFSINFININIIIFNFIFYYYYLRYCYYYVLILFFNRINQVFFLKGGRVAESSPVTIISPNTECNCSLVFSSSVDDALLLLLPATVVETSCSKEELKGVLFGRFITTAGCSKLRVDKASISYVDGCIFGKLAERACADTDDSR